MNINDLLGIENPFSWEKHADYIKKEMDLEVSLGFPDGKHSASVLFDDYCEALQKLGREIPPRPDWYNRLWWPGDL